MILISDPSRLQILNIIAIPVDRRIDEVWRGPLSYDFLKHKPMRCKR